MSYRSFLSMNPSGVMRFLATVEMLSEEVYSELPIQQILIFLAVAVNEGVSMRTIGKIFPYMSQSSISRNVRMLEAPTPGPIESTLGIKPKGHGLIETRRGVENRRAVILYLTDKGKEIRDKIESYTSGEGMGAGS